MGYGTLLVRPIAVSQADAERFLGAMPPEELVQPEAEGLLVGEGEYVSWIERSAIQHSGSAWWNEASPALVDMQIMVSRIVAMGEWVVLGVISPYSSLSRVIIASMHGGTAPQQELMVNLTKVVEQRNFDRLLSLTMEVDGREETWTVRHERDLWEQARSRTHTHWLNLRLQTEYTTFTMSEQFDLSLQEYPTDPPDLSAELQSIGERISGCLSLDG